jgi:homopolymeric O-antigen transport system permease protein
VSALRELFRQREVLQALVWRDLKARYRGSVLGFLWTLLNPLLLMVIYSLVFSVYMRLEVEKFPIFILTGLLPWIWFSSSLLSGATSVIDGSSLIKRVAFPPLILPTVVVTANLINFLLALPLLFIFMIAFGVPVTWAVLSLPVTVAIQYVFTLALAVVLGMLTVRYRDLQHLLANMITLWFFLTPVLYPVNMVPESFHPLLFANPMTPIVLAYHDAMYHGQFPNLRMLGASALVAVVLLAVSLRLYEHWRWVVVEEV